MTFLEFLATRPDLVSTLAWWGWLLVGAVSYRLVFGGAR